MDHQLRIYRVKPGRFDAFVALWREHVVPARAAHGFEVVGAWENRSDDVFTWLVRQTSGGSFAAADKAYYDSPERAALPRDPAGDLEQVTAYLLDPLTLP